MKINNIKKEYIVNDNDTFQQYKTKLNKLTDLIFKLHPNRILALHEQDKVNESLFEEIEVEERIIEKF